MSAVTVRTVHCAFAGVKHPYQHALAFAATFPGIRSLGRECEHSSHPPCKGKNPDGSYRTSSTASYPDGLNQSLGAAIIQELRQRGLLPSLH